MSGNQARVGQLRRLDAIIESDRRAIDALAVDVGSIVSTWRDRAPQTVEVAGVALCEAILGPNTLRRLEELRAFRHRVRHPYEYELDPEKIKVLAASLAEAVALVHADFGTLQSALRSCIHELAE